MKVASLVPSWTETLMTAGVLVAGRTDRCCFPPGRVERIPILMSHNRIDWDAVMQLRPDVVLIDRGENSEQAAKDCPYPFIETHVHSITAHGTEMRRLAKELNVPELNGFADRWDEAVPLVRPVSLSDLPGVDRWIKPAPADAKSLLYLVWKSPWIARGPGTFEYAMLDLFGFGDVASPLPKPILEVDLDEFDPRTTVLLCPTGPYPFKQRQHVLRALEHPAAILDGKQWGWFGLRGVRFLEECVRK